MFLMFDVGMLEPDYSDEDVEPLTDEQIHELRKFLEEVEVETAEGGIA